MLSKEQQDELRQSLPEIPKEWGFEGELVKICIRHLSDTCDELEEALAAERRNWSAEHDERVRLKERLKWAETDITELKATLTAERDILQNLVFASSRDIHSGCEDGECPLCEAERVLRGGKLT